MKILVSGQKHFGEAVFKLCRAQGHEVVAVAAPAWSESRATTGEPLPDRLRFSAEMASVPWILSDQLRAESVPKGTDLIIAAHSHAFIGRKTRNRTALGAIGYHPSLLPLHRGRDAIRWTIHLKERITGGTVFWLNDNVDAGPIAAQAHAFVRPGDTPSTLWREVLMPLGLRLIKRVLADLSGGRKVAVPQDESLATWEPSWDRTPIFRPELPELGNGPANVRTTIVAEEAEEMLTGLVGVMPVQPQRQPEPAQPLFTYAPTPFKAAREDREEPVLVGNGHRGVH
jgi:methionyl-tRNA formyltransferase